MHELSPRYAHVPACAMQIGNFLISVSQGDQIGLGFKLHGSIGTINRREKQGRKRFVQFYNFPSFYLCLNKRVGGRTHTAKPFKGIAISTVFCLLAHAYTLSPLCSLSISSSKLWTQQPYLMLPRCQREWSISGFILSKSRAWNLGSGDEPVLREIKSDRDTVTCMSVVRVGMDGARYPVEWLPFLTRWIGSLTTSLWGRADYLKSEAFLLSVEMVCNNNNNKKKGHRRCESWLRYKWQLIRFSGLLFYVIGEYQELVHMGESVNLACTNMDRGFWKFSIQKQTNQHLHSERSRWKCSTTNTAFVWGRRELIISVICCQVF